MPRPVHFEIAASDPEQLRAFYRDVFGWEFTKWPGPEDYWLITTGPTDQPGINGGFFKPRGPFVGTVNTLEVNDLDAYLEKVRAHGGEVVVEKHPIPGVGWNAYCKDPEGTLFGVHQADAQAGLGGPA